MARAAPARSIGVSAAEANVMPSTATIVNKRELLLAIAERRRSTRWPDYAQVAEFHDGRYESEFVSPYTRGAGNLNATVMLVLQDWSSAEFLSKRFDPEIASQGRKPSLPTNRNLEGLLQKHLGISIGDTYATNLFPFIKRADISASIPERDLVAAAKLFGIPQIEIVRPRLVVCLGFSTFRAVEIAVGREPSGSLQVAIDSPLSVADAAVWCQSHPGGRGRANRNRGGVDRVAADWERMLMAVGLSSAPA